MEEAGSERAQEEPAPQPKKRPASQKASAKSKVKGRAAQKRPAARKPRPNELCPGMPGKPCTFSTTLPGTPAGVHPKRGEKHCMFCSANACERAFASKRPKVLPVLKKLPPEDRSKALINIEHWQGQEKAHEMKSKLTKAKAKPPKEEWKQLLEARKPLQAPMDEEEQLEYEQAVRKDRQRARRKILCPEHKRKKKLQKFKLDLGRLPTLQPTTAACLPHKMKRLVCSKLGASKDLGPCARHVIRFSHKIWSRWTSSG